jgi:hypothetical protein
MTLGHFIYIPGMILLGAVIGYVLSGRVQRSTRGRAIEDDQRSVARRARARAREASAGEGGPRPPAR